MRVLQRMLTVGATCGLAAMSLLPPTAVAPAVAGVPPIGGEIAFQSSRAGFCCRVYTMDADGSDVESPLFTMAPTYDPAWSPDGSRLAFASFARRNNFDVYVMDARGGAPGQRLERLTDDRDRDTAPAWSPDGQRLAFVSDRAGSFDIWAMAANGAGQVDLSGNAANDCGCFEPFNVFGQPAYSPSGDTIAFTSDLADPGGNLDVYVMDADGSHIRRITRSAAVDAEADWSPDGSRLSYASTRDGDLEIYVRSADGAGPLLQLTRNTAPDTQPDWSPNGRRIAFTSERDGNAEIYVMQADGSGQRNLTNDPSLDERPDWRPTGG